MIKFYKNCYNWYLCKFFPQKYVFSKLMNFHNLKINSKLIEFEKNNETVYISFRNTIISCGLLEPLIEEYYYLHVFTIKPLMYKYTLIIHNSAQKNILYKFNIQNKELIFYYMNIKNIHEIIFKIIYNN